MSEEDDKTTLIVCQRITDRQYTNLPQEQRDCEFCKVRLIVSPSTLARVEEPRIFSCVKCATERGYQNMSLHPATRLAYQEALDWCNMEKGRN